MMQASQLGRAVVAAALPVCAAAQQVSPLIGEWCPEDGPVLIVDQGGIGDSEHTVCDFDVPLGAGNIHSSAVICRAYRFAEAADGSVEAIQTRETKDFVRLATEGADRMRYRFDSLEAWWVAPRCAD